jgi:hypothetical protein
LRGQTAGPSGVVRILDRVSVFKRSANDGDEPSEVAALRDQVATLSRQAKELDARLTDEMELLWTVAAPAWLIDFITSAKADGWIVERRVDAIIFHRPEGAEHSFPIGMPLPEDPSRIVRELRMRLMVFRSAA